MKKILSAAILLLITTTTFAQVSSRPDSLSQAKYRTEASLDLTLPDFDTKEIDYAFHQKDDVRTLET